MSFNFGTEGMSVKERTGRPLLSVVLAVWLVLLVGLNYATVSRYYVWDFSAYWASARVIMGGVIHTGIVRDKTMETTSGMLISCIPPLPPGFLRH